VQFFDSKLEDQTQKHMV